MVTSVKNKIRAGTIFLFCLLLLSGGLGIYYVIQLKKDAQQILKNNYESLSYAHAMQQSLDSILSGNSATTAHFENQLMLQRRNITETGEIEATDSVTHGFRKLQAGDYSAGTQIMIRAGLHSILSLNMNAIKVKNEQAGFKAENAQTFLTFIVVLIFIIAITFSYNFPGIVTDPIQKLTEAIYQIGKKNYKHRIHLERKDEFGQMADAYNSMAERLEYFENSNLNKILFEKSRAEAVINSLKDASIGIDKNQTILFANDQAMQLLGLSTDELVGKSVTDISKSNDLFRFLTEDGNASPFKIVLANKENYFIKEVIAVRQKEGAENKVIVLRNITSFKELDVAKTNFIATISHELKTPLASSNFGIKLLEDERIGSLSAEQKDLIKQLKLDNQRMLKILSELLNLSQLETGKIEINLKEVDPVTIVESAISFVQSEANDSQITIEKTLEDSLPKVKADIEKTGWVLNNLLVNALKFSPPDSRIIVSSQKMDRNVVFSVTDFGPGISATFHEKIFDRYFKVPGSKSGGTGLGLAIAKDFINAMNGKIWVESKEGQGSRFSFSLKIANMNTI